MTAPNTALLDYIQGLAARPEVTPAPTSDQQLRRDQVLARLVPLDQRLAAALAKLPADLLEQGVQIDQLCALVSGRQRQHPSRQEIAGALRRLKWTKYRCYQDHGPSRNYWFPPTTASQALAEAKQRLRDQAKSPPTT